MPVTHLEFVAQVASTTSNVTVNQFMKYLAEASLVLRPPFQRNLVWNADQQSFLIDSVLRGLPVPEIYVQLATSADGAERVVVVDGQQRISACLRYLAGEFRLSGEEDLDPRWRNCTFSELDPTLQKRFRSYELIVRRLPADLEEYVLREIFRRLNKTVEPLLPQELRHAAYTGPFLKFVEDAGGQPVLGEVGVFTPRDYLRRRSDELMAEVAYALTSKAFPNKKEGLDELFLAYERQGLPEGVIADLESRFGRALLQLEPIASALRRTRFRNKSDFYTLFVALAKNAERLPLDAAGASRLETILREFSLLVNDLKREEGEQRPVDPLLTRSHGGDALKYLRAVERAASDRLSRVRRDEALQNVVGPLLAAGEVRGFESDDTAWRNAESPDEDDESDIFEESAHARATLNSADDV